MSDLISRQAAIDAIDEISREVDDGDGFDYAKWREYFCDLPPAEPHWIPVTERLPNKEEKSYWVCLEGGGQCQCRWTNDMYGLGANEWSKWGWHVMDKPQYSVIVAWMPLPEPYKGVTE